jgi:PAS domain S-box-containing protein
MMAEGSGPDDAAHREAEAVLERLAAVARPAPVDTDPGKRTTGGTDATPPRGAHATPLAALPAWSAQNFHDLIEALPDGVVVINSDGFIVLVNEQAEALFGYPRSEMLGQAVELLMPERIRGEHVGFRQAYFRDPKPRPMGARALQLVGRRKDGSEVPVEISLSPLHTPEGLLVTSVVRDISARKREEAKFRTLVENIPAVTFIAPLDESVPELYVSPQIEQMLGFSQKEWLEDPVLWHRQLHPEDSPRWNVEFATTCNAAVPFRSTYRFIAKDGRVVWVHGSANMVRGADGQLLFLQGVAFDITPIKDAEEALRRLNAELDRRVQERTAALTEKTEELQQFAYATTHDSKGPLSTILISAQRMKREAEGQLGEKPRKWLGTIIGTAAGMRQLIDKLRDYEKVTRLEKTQSVNCDEIVGRACNDLQADIEGTEAEVQVTELPVVQGVPEHLQLVFQNLVSNAIKYRCADRPPRIEIGAERRGPDWQFWVRDNGIGIEARYIRQILEKPLGVERRLHLRSEIEGWGYGLATCQKTVTRHGGRLWIESEFGTGTTVYFTLPAG